MYETDEANLAGWLLCKFTSACHLPTTFIFCSLEGDEFETDEENLAAWQELFKQKHYWAAEVGPATFIGLSTVRFRRCTRSLCCLHCDGWFTSACVRACLLPGAEVRRFRTTLTTHAKVQRQLFCWAAVAVRVSIHSRTVPAAVCLCSNPYSVHEVHVDEEQMTFFKAQVSQQPPQAFFEQQRGSRLKPVTCAAGTPLRHSALCHCCETAFRPAAAFTSRQHLG